MGKPGHVMHAQDAIIGKLTESGAVDAAPAVTAQQLGIGRFQRIQRDVLDRFVELGIAARSGDSYYLDAARAQALQTNRTGRDFWATESS